MILLFVLCVSTAFALVMYRLYVKSKQMIYAPADRVVNEAVAYFDLRDFERLHEHLKTMDFSTLQLAEQYLMLYLPAKPSNHT